MQNMGAWKIVMRVDAVGRSSVFGLEGGGAAIARLDAILYALLAVAVVEFYQPEGPDLPNNLFFTPLPNVTIQRRAACGASTATGD